MMSVFLNQLQRESSLGRVKGDLTDAKRRVGSGPTKKRTTGLGGFTSYWDKHPRDKERVRTRRENGDMKDTIFVPPRVCRVACWEKGTASELVSNRHMPSTTSPIRTTTEQTYEGWILHFGLIILFLQINLR